MIADTERLYDECVRNLDQKDIDLVECRSLTPEQLSEIEKSPKLKRAREVFIELHTCTYHPV